MELAIKSEVDSRILVYPLIKLLYNYGTVAVYTSNKSMSRLIENELEGGFRDVRIVINPEADLEAMKMSDDWSSDKYDFTIYDNVGAVEYDQLICILTNRLSDSYVSDLIFVIQDESTNIIRFGSPAPKPKEDKSKHKTKGKGKHEEEEEAEKKEEEVDMSYNKWNDTKTDEQALQEALTQKSSVWCKYPSYEVLELMEGRHQFYPVDDTLSKEVYKILGKYLSVEERLFLKGARVKDEGSSVLSGTDVW